MKLTIQDFENASENEHGLDCVSMFFPIAFNNNKVYDIEMEFLGDHYKNQSTLDRINNFITSLPDYNEIFREEFLKILLESDDNMVSSYLDFHLEDIPQDEWAQIFPDITEKNITYELIIKDIKFSRLRIHWHEEDKDFGITIDYRISDILSDEILAVHCTLEGKINYICTES